MLTIDITDSGSASLVTFLCHTRDFESIERTGSATAISKNVSTEPAIVYRYVKEFEKGFVRAKQAVRIIVTWKYFCEKGMPSVGERQRMGDLEDALTPLQENRFLTLALVSTGDNLKEWTYYAQVEEGFLNNLNLALRSKLAFPIEIHISPDPMWRAYDQLAAGVQQ